MFSKLFAVTARVRDFVESRTHAPRRLVSLSLCVSLSGPRNKQSGPLPPSYALRLTMNGSTRDISESGLAMILPAVHLGGFYFTDGERKLNVSLDLDDTTVRLEVLPVRYEKLEGEVGYLVGAQILHMNAADRADFSNYLERLSGRKAKHGHALDLTGGLTPKPTTSLGMYR